MAKVKTVNGYRKCELTGKHYQVGDIVTIPFMQEVGIITNKYDYKYMVEINGKGYVTTEDRIQSTF